MTATLVPHFSASLQRVVFYSCFPLLAFPYFNLISARFYIGTDIPVYIQKYDGVLMHDTTHRSVSDYDLMYEERTTTEIDRSLLDDVYKYKSRGRSVCDAFAVRV